MIVLSKNTGFAVGLALSVWTATPIKSQVDKTLTAYAKSYEQEKRLNYFGAIRSMYEVADTSAYEVNLRLGWLYYKAGQEKKSILHYRNAIKLSPKGIEARIGFGYPAYLLEDMADLIEEDKRILELDPNNRATNSNLALIYFYNRQYAKALPYFQRVVQMYPFDYDNNLSLAWTYLYLGKKAEAEKHFNIVWLYSPGDVSAKEGLDNLGKTPSADEKTLNAFTKSYELAAISNYKGAIAALKEGYDKSSYFANLRLGWLLYLAGQHTDALTYYKIAIELEPSSVEAKLGYAYPLEAMGNKTDLKMLYESILALDPYNTAVNYKLGYIYYERKEYATALKYFETVVQLYPFSYDGLLMYAWTSFLTNKFDESHQLFYKVLCLSPGDKSASHGFALKPGDDPMKKPESKEILRPK